ncbi:hypothetical protein F5X99DRAFT_417405 [Biscogniauxia marginata]|nr:hypothetical protein F5X99DRAFT_417405 [Biscogniauxia marginata]
MRNYDLSQLASQVPGLIKEVSKKRQPQDPAPLEPLDLNSFFDFTSFYGEDQGADPDSRSRSDSSSTPELTSGSSEEDGAPSPGPNVDSFRLKAAVKKVKQQDDRFTVPQREIRPKGALPYPCNLQLDSAPGTNTSGLPDSQSPTSATFMLSSPSSTSSISFDAPTTRGSPINRGKRTSPLKDAYRVAEIRKIGACSRCKTRKVQCDEQVPCSRCYKDAKKYRGDDCTELAKQMCIRHLFHINDCVFQAIGDTEANRSPLTPGNGLPGVPSTWKVSFWMKMPSRPEIDVPVVGFHTSLGNGHMAQQYDLDKHNLPQDSDIIRWASCQMARETSPGLQYALDILLAHCAEKGQSSLPHFDIVEKVHQMRCWYRVWRQKRFFCQAYPGSLEELPGSVRQGLKNIARSRMKGLEPQILEFFEKTAKPSQRLLIWASMMQMILLYRDMYHQMESQALCPSQEQTLRMAANLFSKLVVTCELHFGKKKPERIAEDGSIFKAQINKYFNDVEHHYSEFRK